MEKQDLKTFFTPWNIALIAALAAGLWLIWGYISLVAISALAAYVFNPINKRLYKSFGGRKVAAAFTTVLLSFLIILIPLLIIGFMIVIQATHFVNEAKDAITSSNLTSSGMLQDIVNWINRTLMGITGNAQTITVTQLTDTLSNLAINFGNWLLTLIKDVVSNIPRFFTQLFLYTFIMGSILAYQSEITDAMEHLNPMGSDISRLYIQKMKAMTRAMLKGQFFTAFLQGTESALAFALIGYGDLFFVMWPIFTFLSIIPLGAGIITIPLGIIIMATGRPVAGAFIILNHILIVSSIDNFTRPKFVTREAYLPVALTLLATFAGLQHFGFFGLFYGPIIMILVITTLDVYLKVNGLPVLFVKKEKDNQTPNPISRLIGGVRGRFAKK